MSYADLLKDPRWQRKRLEVLEAAGWKCSSCDESTRELHVHHKRYIKGKMPWEYEWEDLIVLCKPCHDRWHKNLSDLEFCVARCGLPALENIAGYAVGQASLKGCFAEYIPTPNNIGGLLGFLGIRGKDGYQFVLSRMAPGGSINVQDVFVDTQKEQCFKQAELEEMFDSLMKKLGLPGKG